MVSLKPQAIPAWLSIGLAKYPRERSVSELLISVEYSVGTDLQRIRLPLLIWLTNLNFAFLSLIDSHNRLRRDMCPMMLHTHA